MPRISLRPPPSCYPCSRGRRCPYGPTTAHLSGESTSTSEKSLSPVTRTSSRQRLAIIHRVDAREHALFVLCQFRAFWELTRVWELAGANFPRLASCTDAILGRKLASAQGQQGHKLAPVTAAASSRPKSRRPSPRPSSRPLRSVGDGSRAPWGGSPAHAVAIAGVLPIIVLLARSFRAASSG